MLQPFWRTWSQETENHSASGWRRISCARWNGRLGVLVRTRSWFSNERWWRLEWTGFSTSDVVGSNFGANLSPTHEPSQMDPILWQPISELEPTLGDLIFESDWWAWGSNGNPTLDTDDSAMFERGVFRNTWQTLICQDGESAAKKGSRHHRWNWQSHWEASRLARRSRFVAREFNLLQHRDGIYSPALGPLDMQDAFLQVPHTQPRDVKLGETTFVILNCLPAQPDATLWYSFFVSKLQKRANAVLCAEQPCILKIDTGGILLLHVDDIMFLGREQWAVDTLIPQLGAEFKLTRTYVPRETGWSFEFLKRTHMLENLDIQNWQFHQRTCAHHAGKFTKADGG